MTNLDRIKEWRRGCSNAYKDRPETCPECTRALIDAIENDLKEQEVIGAMPSERTKNLARALLAEMDKPGDVWKDAPENAIRSLTYFYDANRAYISEIERTRDLPKSRARVIAEEFFDSEAYIGFCEIAILKALAEQEAGKC